uniref:hypothetical protein n=1 Tax=Burkholderia diffusa TaxID=488732 RepID=UPI001CC40950
MLLEFEKNGSRSAAHLSRRPGREAVPSSRFKPCQAALRMHDVFERERKRLRVGAGAAARHHDV